MSGQIPDEHEQVTVRAADLRALLDAVDTDYLSTENLPDLEERIDRLAAAAGLGDDEGAGQQR